MGSRAIAYILILTQACVSFACVYIHGIGKKMMGIVYGCLYTQTAISIRHAGMTDANND